MEIKSIKARLRVGDTISIEIPEEDDDRADHIGIGVYSNGNVIVHNDEEERIYHLRKTKHGGFKLIEGELL